MHRTLQPEGWVKPRGYANGISARGRTIHLAGQIGWDSQARIVSDDLVEQIAQALRNIVAILASDDAGPQHIVNLVWWLGDRREYNARLSEIGQVYREIIGRHFPAMSAIQIAGFVEDGVKVEIQATAVVPEP